MTQISISKIEFYFPTAQISFYFWVEFYLSLGELCISTLQLSQRFSHGACMHLGLRTSGVELVFLSAWRCVNSLHNTIRCTAMIQCIYWHTVLLICAPQVYVGVHLRNCFRTFCVSSIWTKPQCFSYIIT